jgi:aryl-alcohol dehydrogenase-like predicted oxidoreductase
VIAASELGRIVFGCGNFGGMGSSPDLRAHGDERETAFALLDHARALGLTRFDTANTYGGGASERFLGEWLGRQDRAWRAGIEVATKVGNPFGCPPDDRPLSRGQVAHHLDQSLRRLGVERIDLYYLHEFDPSTPLEETLAALEAALAAGKIARFGVSNASLADLDAVLTLVTGALRPAFACVQNEFNLIQQRDLAELIPRTAAAGVGYVAFSPLAGGLLTGKYRADRAAAPGTRLASAPAFYEHLLTPATFAAIADLEHRAGVSGETVAGAALRFVLEAPGDLALIIAPRSLEQFSAYGIGAG